MKRLLTIILITTSLWACNNNHTTGSETGKEAEHTEPIDKSDSLPLNKGGKWNADESTNINVARLQTTADQLAKTHPDNIEAYRHISNELQAGLNQLIKECKMKGADHDALHLWLEPVLRETKELSTVTDTVQAERLFHSIRTRLKDYNLYFE